MKIFYYVFWYFVFLNLNVFAFVGAVDPTYPPFALYTDDGELQGFEVDVQKELAKRIGEEADIQNMDYAASLVGLSAGKVDLIVSVDKADISPDKVFFTRHLMTTYLSMVTNVNNKKYSSEKDIIDNKNVRIGVVQGTVSQIEAEKKYGTDKIVPFDTAETMYQSLVQNKIDVVVNDSVVNTYYFQKSKRAKHLKVVVEAIMKSPNVMAISKDRPDLNQKVQKAIIEMENDGTLGEIRKKWDFVLD